MIFFIFIMEIVEGYIIYFELNNMIVWAVFKNQFRIFKYVYQQTLKLKL